MITAREPYNPQRSQTNRTILPYPYIGLVKQNIDAQYMGRISVWIPELCGDPNDQASWIVCTYCSPFAGATDLATTPGYQSNPQVAQQSYGWVGIPPDLNNQVLVVFVGGEMSRAYWIGCVYQQNMNWMVPGIAVNVTTHPPPLVTSPVIEYNKAAITGTPDNPRRPPFGPLTSGLAAEGLNSDVERGTSTTTMRRESPPKVYGFLSPDGNSIHIDDFAGNEFIRLRTKSGCQILIHESTGFVYINSKNGNAWFEVSDAGIDGFTMNSISLRAQQDFNIRADRNINFDAGQNINMRAGQQITMSAGTDLQIGVTDNIVVSASSATVKTTGGDLQINASGNIRLQSGADTTSLAAGNWLRDASTIVDNGGGAPAATANAATVPTPQATLDTTITPSTGMWRSSGGSVSTIVSRMPTHEPWPSHPNSAVPPPPSGPANITAPGTYGQGSSSNNNPDGTLNDTGCNIGSAGTKPVSTEVYNAIANASAKTGAPLSTMLAFADMESSFQPGVGAGTSSATGLYQFTSGTWNGMVSQYGSQYNVSSSQINDASANALMGGQFIQNNSNILQNQGISSPTPGQLYIMHFMGSSGGPALISAAQNNPSASAASLFPAAASANRSIFYNSDGSAKTTSQVYNNLTSTADSKAAAYASQDGLPAPCTRQNGTAGNTPTTPNTPANPNAAPGDYGQYVGKYWGQNQQCVSLVKYINNLPATSNWYAGNGDLVNNPPPVGTAIATFDPNGTYANSYQTSHAAIYLGPATGGAGIEVLEQYNGQPARLKNYYATGTGINNANNYMVVNTKTTST